MNINNLAAVPSIVFGLLGLAVFIGFFGLPRSAPLVGAMVLTLLTLPTIIIASRAALKAVPPSIREAALGMGASKIQTVAHHVLPLAMPGMLTGTIIGMARALGESAPLLMIGMVAFIVDIPKGVTDAATALPVQVYLWSGSDHVDLTVMPSGRTPVVVGAGLDPRNYDVTGTLVAGTDGTAPATDACQALKCQQQNRDRNHRRAENHDQRRSVV